MGSPIESKTEQRREKCFQHAAWPLLRETSSAPSSAKSLTTRARVSHRVPHGQCGEIKRILGSVARIWPFTVMAIRREDPMAKPLSSLPPSVEHRLSAWAEIQYRLDNPPERRIRPTITISRRFGCEGFPLAERLKRLTEEASQEPWNIYDRSLIEKVAHEEGISMRILKHLGDTSRALEALGVPATTHVIHDKAFEKIAKYIVQISQVGNAIVVGRGGAILCGGMKNCFHFRLDASLGFRVNSITKRLEISQKEAEHLVETGSKQREKFISYSLGADITELGHYDALFNNEHHTVEEMAVAILAYVRSAFPDKSYFKH